MICNLQVYPEAAGLSPYWPADTEIGSTSVLPRGLLVLTVKVLARV